MKVDTFFKDETAWLTQKALAELFGVKVPAVNKHLKNSFESQELAEDSVVSILETTPAVRKSYQTRFYNLAAIIAVGYRVNSFQATQFRIWATTGQTAAELIYTSPDAAKLHMGIATWKHAPAGKILKSDVTVAKNYLNEAHVKELNRIVSAYPDLAENLAERGIVMKMADWIVFLHGFLELSNYPVLQHKGKVSPMEAKLKAEDEYESFRKIQDQQHLSDFDKAIKRIEGKSHDRRNVHPRSEFERATPAWFSAQ